MNKICVVQPFLVDYRRDVFCGLAEYCPVDLVISPTPSGSGFAGALLIQNSRVRCVMVPTYCPFGNRLGMIQWGLAKYMVRERPDVVLIFANPRYLSLWTTLLLGRLLRIPIHAHGHGVYKKRRIRTSYRLMMTALLRLANSYICYAPIVRQSFLDHGFSGRNLTVADNSLINRFPVHPEEKTGNERGILFLGRLRPGSRVDMLVRVMERIRQETRVPLELHVVGTGEEAPLLEREAKSRPWISLHGEIYDPQLIRRISLSCFVGCYPGNAGLSVVHLMSLSLPVIAHNDMPSHQGPEPSFLRNGVSGILYDHRNAEPSLYRAILSLASEGQTVGRMQKAAFEDYQRLVTPSLAARFWTILCEAQAAVTDNASLERS